MRASADIDGLKLIQKDKRPVTIFGVPGRVQTVLTLKNTTDQRLTLKQVSLEAPDLLDLEGKQLSSALVSGRIEPNQQTDVLLDVPINPATAPGSYEVTLQIGGEAVRTNVVVYESAELEIEPDTITIHAGKTLVSEHHFTLTNVGNVPLKLGQSLVVPIQGQDDLGHMLRHAVLETREHVADTKTKSSNQIIPLLLDSLAQHLPSSASFTLESAELAPGQSHPVKASLQLPDNLRPNQYYTVNVELYGAAVSFDVFAFEPDA